jgi:hypothetical protein
MGLIRIDRPVADCWLGGLSQLFSWLSCTRYAGDQCTPLRNQLSPMEVYASVVAMKTTPLVVRAPLTALLRLPHCSIASLPMGVNG